MARKPIKRLLNILKWVFLSLLLLFGVALALPFIFEDEVKSFALEQINNSVAADIKVEEINLSFIKRFPEASLQFQNVRIEQKVGFTDSLDLLTADNILIKFSLWNILKKNYAFENIEFVNLVFNPKIDAKGQVNYTLFYPEEERDTNHFFVDLKHVKLSDSRILFTNELTRISLDIALDKLEGQVQLGDDMLGVAMQSDMTVNRWMEDGVYVMRNKSLHLDIESQYSVPEASLTIRKGNINYQNFGLKLSGKATQLETSPNLDLHLQLAALDMEELIRELPAEQKKGLKDYGLQGKFETQVHIHGVVDKNNLPSFDASFEMRNGRAIIKEQDLTLRDIELSGNFTNGRRQSIVSSQLQLQNFSFHTDAGFFKGNLEVSNFKDPKIRIQADSKLELEALQAFLPEDMIESATGKMDLEIDAKVGVHNWQDTSARSFDLSKLSGNLILEGAQLQLKDDERSFEKMNGSLSFNKNKITIDQMEMVVNQQELKLKGSLRNLTSLLNPLSREKLILQLSVVSPWLDLDVLMPEQKNTGSEQATADLPKNIDVYLNFDIGAFSWKPYEAKNIRGKLSLIDGDMVIDPLRFDAMEGSFNGEIHYTIGDNDLNILQAKGKVKEMNITKVFKTFNNFDQQTLTHENIKGKITSDFDVHIFQNKQGEWIEESISCAAHVVMDEGELINVKELNALKSFTRIDDFSHIRFKRLENNVQINNSQLLIPEMDINSDKMNIKVFGKHDFSNAYEYHFEIKLREILARKVEEKQWTEFGEVQSDARGGRTLFLMVVGQGEDFEVKLDRKKTSKQVKQEISDEGKEVKQALKQEFGPKDTPQSKARQEKRKKKKEEKELLKQQEEGKTIIEWDDF